LTSNLASIPFVQPREPAYTRYYMSFSILIMRLFHICTVAI